MKIMEWKAEMKNKKITDAGSVPEVGTEPEQEYSDFIKSGYYSLV